MPIFTKFAQDNIVAYAVAALGFGGRATGYTTTTYILSNIGTPTVPVSNFYSCLGLGGG